MKKAIDKVAIVAHVCISCVFVLLTLLILFNVIPIQYENNAVVMDSVTLVLVISLSVVYVIITLYLLYVNFSQNQMLKYVELYRDSSSAMTASAKTVKKMVVNNAAIAGKVKVKKVKIASDGDVGHKLKVWVEVSTDEVSFTLDTLRCLCEESFTKMLGLKFSSIDFKIEKIHSNFKPDLEKAKEKAKTMDAERKYSKDCYNQPAAEQGNNLPSETETQSQPAEDTVQEENSSEEETNQDN